MDVTTREIMGDSVAENWTIARGTEVYLSALSVAGEQAIVIDEQYTKQ